MEKNNKLDEREDKRKSFIGAMVDNNNTVAEEVFAELKPSKGKRTKRMSILVTPEIYEKAQKKCTELGMSFNECINQILESWLK